MDVTDALRLTEVMLALALIQQSAEHLVGPKADRGLFAVRIVLCVLLALGAQTPWVLWGLCAVAVLQLHRFDGPYNGGADKMALLILTCLALAQSAPTPQWQELAFGYLAVQLVLSYVVSGWVKLCNPDWRSGAALRDVFWYSAYPVSENLRRLGQRSGMMLGASAAVIGFELLFPLALLDPTALLFALGVAATFHFANACLFGLNRFFWIWLCAYPSLIWFQGRVFNTSL